MVEITTIIFAYQCTGATAGERINKFPPRHPRNTVGYAQSTDKCRVDIADYALSEEM
jgi:hypothetical protein